MHNRVLHSVRCKQDVNQFVKMLDPGLNRVQSMIPQMECRYIAFIRSYQLFNYIFKKFLIYSMSLENFSLCFIKKPLCSIGGGQ